MRIAKCYLKSAAPYCQGRPISPKQRDETHEDHEKRCWRERCHTRTDGTIFIPSFVFSNALAEAAKYKGIQIPGRGKERFTKHFESGVSCFSDLDLNINVSEIEPWRHFVPADGKRGGTKRVWKLFPLINNWEGAVEYHVLDEVVTNEVFGMHLEDAGKFIGIGSFRVRNNGIFGRFTVEKIQWEL